ncbi:hypothetical protein LC20_00515 [Yersinia hibernica]|uniref:Acyltransferase 3 domain-containing protein n=1 Tax=Yersinia enterocolitica LC20 TaxID=1443113 RepID=A0A7U4GCN7_YEREN|nr:hypothetical protein LC20_00515 [Yersinia hibernica]
MGYEFTHLAPCPLLLGKITEWYLNTFNYVSYWAGVDIFLAISGFLMFKIISKEIKTNGRTFYSFFHFISKRIFRLYPALIFWVIMSVITAWYIQPDFNANAKLALSNAIPSLFSYSNLFWYNCSVNELNCGSSDLSGITWSLSLEWQLYLIPSIFQ